MATYYFNASVDNDWEEPGNWFLDEGGSSAGSVPTSTDNAIVQDECYLNGNTTVANLTVKTYANDGLLGLTSNVQLTVTNVVELIGAGSIFGLNSSNTETLSANTVSLDEAGKLNYLTISTNTLTVQSSTISGAELSNISLTGNLIYEYGFTITTSNVTVTGSTYYTNYPTLYYNAAVSTDWHNNLNWWVDSGHTQQSYDIPSSSDDVVINGSIQSTASDMYCNNATINYGTINSSGLGVTLNVTSTLTVSDTYYIGDSMYAGPDIICTNAVFNGNSYVTGNTDISASGTVTFNSTSELGHSTSGGATIAGEVVFNDSSEFISGTITGNASFYGTSVFTGGTVTLNVTVYYSHPLPFTYGGTINGSLLYSGYSPRTVYFYHTTSSEDWGGNFWYDATTGGGSSTYAPNPDISLDTVIIEASVGSNTGNLDATVGSLTVNGVYVASTFVSIDITCDYANFNDSCYLNTGATLTQSVNHGGNNITFSDLSENDGTVNPDTPPVVFEDSASNDGTVNGDVDVYYPSEKPVGGTVTGFITYYGYTLYFGSSTDGDWNNPNNWFLDSANTSPYNDIPSDTMPYQNVILQSNVTASNQPPYPGNIGGTPSAYDLLALNNLSITAISVDIYGLATFSDTSYLNYDATINGNALFQDSSFNSGAIVGTATFTLSSAEIMIADAYGGSYGGIEFQYGKGVNGSNILGIV
jgi:hypothetical protein